MYSILVYAIEVIRCYTSSYRSVSKEQIPIMRQFNFSTPVQCETALESPPSHSSSFTQFLAWCRPVFNEVFVQWCQITERQMLFRLFLFIRYQMLEHKWFCWLLFISQQCAMLWCTNKRTHTLSICLIESFFSHVVAVLSHSVAILFIVLVGIHAFSVSACDCKNGRLDNTPHIFPLIPLLL